MRPVAYAKPHIFKGSRCWWCCMAEHWMGTGYSAKDAYDNWLARNLDAA